MDQSDCHRRMMMPVSKIQQMYDRTGTRYAYTQGPNDYGTVPGTVRTRYSTSTWTNEWGQSNHARRHTFKNLTDVLIYT
jgi:hypothetical protein